MKARDVFNNSHFLLAKKGSFDQAFPQIEKITITLKESGDGVTPQIETRTYDKSAGEYINCSNPLCYNGGVCVGDMIRLMVYDKNTHAEELKMCQGYEGSPKGRRKYGRCINSFRVTIDIKFKEGRQPDVPPQQNTAPSI
jgi:hypothetical protein